MAQKPSKNGHEKVVSLKSPYKKRLQKCQDDWIEIDATKKTRSDRGAFPVFWLITTISITYR
jgi:hypothetical protein